MECGLAAVSTIKQQKSGHKKQLCRCESTMLFDTRKWHAFGIWCESSADAIIILSMIVEMCVNRERENEA